MLDSGIPPRILSAREIAWAAQSDGYSLLDMNTTPQVSQSPPPVYGALSVLSPFVGSGMAASLGFLFPRHGDEAFIYPALAFVLTLIALPCGLFFAFRASKRHERYRALSWIGLFLNVMPLLFYVLYAVVW